MVSACYCWRCQNAAVFGCVRGLLLLLALMQQTQSYYSLLLSHIAAKHSHKSRERQRMMQRCQKSWMLLSVINCSYSICVCLIVLLVWFEGEDLLYCVAMSACVFVCCWSYRSVSTLSPCQCGSDVGITTTNFITNRASMWLKNTAGIWIYSNEAVMITKTLRLRSSLIVLILLLTVVT